MGRYWVGSPGPGSAGECVTVLHVNWGFVNSVLTSHEIELQPNLEWKQICLGQNKKCVLTASDYILIYH